MGAIEEAIEALERGEFATIADAARAFQCDRSTLSRRYRHVTMSREELADCKRILSLGAEKELVDYILKLSSRAIPPTNLMIRRFASEIAGKPVGKNWVYRFLHRHEKPLKLGYLQGFDLLRKKADNEQQYQAYFDLLHQKITKYNVEPHNIYNMDEKGFLLGVLYKVKRVFSRKDWKRGALIGVGQDGSRDWFTCVAAICADGSALPLALIYQGAGGIQEQWIHQFNAEEDFAYFTSSPNGWTNTDLGFDWLTHIFDRHTRKKARSGRDYRLLIIDGHNSHANMRFLEWCNENRILPMVFPPHSTHRLQPLDVSIFAPLGHFYSDELNAFHMESQAMVFLGKRDFYGFFKVAWSKALTTHNIESAWRKTGIQPWDPPLVLTAVSKRPDTSSSSGTSTISASDYHKLRTMVFSNAADTRKLKIAFDEVCAEIALLKVENEGLRKTIITQKQRVKRNKPLFEALRDEDEVKAQFYSPTKLQQAKDLLSTREAEEQQKRTQKQAEKARKQYTAQSKRLEIQQRRQKVAEERARKNAAKEDIATAKQANQQLRKEARAAPRKHPKRSQPPQPKEAVVIDNEADNVVVEVKCTVTRSGRSTARPARYNT